MISKQNVRLEVIHGEGVGVKGLRYEGVSGAEGGGALEGSFTGGGCSAPPGRFVVSFLAFHEHGLRYPAHWFLRRLLNEWGLELQHLNPTGVLHITSFVTVCEAFLRMDPHVDLFRQIFSG